MKTGIRALLFGLMLPGFVHVSTCAQGTIFFSNRNLRDPATSQLYHAPVTLPDGTGVSGSAFTAGLFLVGGNSLTPVFTAPFRTGGFFQDSTGLGYYVSVPGVSPGAPATFRVRVWETTAGSYDSAVTTGRLHGEFATGQPDNNLFVPALGPPPGGAIPDPDLGGIQALTLVPEPAAGTLLIFGAFICFALRRRRNG